MVDFFVIQIKLGTITIDEVPEKWRNQVVKKIVDRQ